MRILALLFVLSIITVFLLGQTLSTPSPSNSSPPAGVVRNLGIDEGRMRRRAQIQVVPFDQLVANKAELQSLRARVAEAEAETDKLEISDPAVREQFSRQHQLLQALLAFAKMQDTDAGKTPTVLEVQRHLNNIEGQTLCEACHGGIVVKSSLESGTLERWPRK